MANLNIPSKNTGDTLSAAEFNQVVSVVNSKVDAVSGKGLSTNDYTNSDKSTLTSLPDQIASLSEQVSQIISGSQVIQDTERICGSYRIGGNELNLYECAFKLDELPTAAGTTKEYEISETPLGKNTYLAINSFAVSDGTGFYPNKYSIEKAYVDSDYKTKVVVKCDLAPASTCFGVLHLQYVKLEYELVEFVVKGLTGDAATNAALVMPPLKYDKKFAYSYTFDDCTVMAYGKAFCMINKKWVDDWKFYHVGQQKTTGAIPARPLGYTDGLGIERRFKIGVAIWPDSRNSQIDDFMKPTNKPVNQYYPHLVWNDLSPMLEYGNEIYFHDINTADYGTDIPGILEGMKAAQKITLENTNGHGMKVMARPGGNNLYCAAAREYDDIVMMAVENNTDIGPAVNITFDNDEVELKKISQYRRFVESTPTVDQLWPDLNTAALAGNYAWKHDFSHGPENFQYILDLFEKLNDEFGKDGLDALWFATLDEVYEYWFIRRYAKIRKELAADGVKFSILVPNETYFRHKEFTVQLTGSYSGALSAELTKGDAYGFNFGNINNKFSINIDLEKRAYEMADKYSNLYLENQDGEVRDDAVYFINQLRSDLQTVFNSRLSSIDTAPTLNSISIDGGASTTNSRQVTISFSRTGVITHYKLSESSNLDGVEWIEGSVSTVSFILSSGYGTKTVYARIKNKYGESDIVSTSISYEEAVTDALALNSIIINGGESSTTNNNVTVTMSIAGSPTHYMLSESSSFIGAEWLAYQGVLANFTLSSGNGSKTIYCKIKNSTNESSVKSSSITLESGVGQESKTIACFSSVSLSDYNSVNVNNPRQELSDNSGKVHITYLRNDTAGDDLSTRPTTSSGFVPDEVAGAPYPYDVYKGLLATHGPSGTERYLYFEATTGRYRIKIYANTKYGNAGDSTHRVYVINDVERLPDFEVKGNVSNFLTWENISPIDGRIKITLRCTKDWVVVPVNVIEFELIS